MANQMGAAPSLRDAASLHDGYVRSSSPCAGYDTYLRAGHEHVPAMRRGVVRGQKKQGFSAARSASDSAAAGLALLARK
eukprot:COSAG01_NODE_291_length_19378_cov_38.136418_7_plen_79_part_00